MFYVVLGDLWQFCFNFGDSYSSCLKIIGQKYERNISLDVQFTFKEDAIDKWDLMGLVKMFKM